MLCCNGLPVVHISTQPPLEIAGGSSLVQGLSPSNPAARQHVAITLGMSSMCGPMAHQQYCGCQCTMRLGINTKVQAEY